MPPSRLTILSLSALWALSLGAYGGEAPELNPETRILDPVPVTEVADTAPAPEPTATLLAGIGGLALLFFAMRRK